MAAGKGTGDRIFVADRTTGSVHEPGALLEVLQEIVIHETPSTFVKGTVDGNNITLALPLISRWCQWVRDLTLETTS